MEVGPLQQIFSPIDIMLVKFFLNAFTEFAEFSDKNNIILKSIAVLEPTISCVRNQHSMSAPQAVADLGFPRGGCANPKGGGTNLLFA